MKLSLCTLVICLSVLASVCTLSTLVRAEGKRIRSSIPKALTEPLGPSAHEESVVQKLDAINAQLSSLNKRLSLLEDAPKRAPRTLTSTGPTDLAQAQLRSLTTSLNSLAASQAKLEKVPDHLDALTTYLDRSFEHLENAVGEAAVPDELLDSVSKVAGRVEDIDSYFTPLYAFLGLSYDPDNQDLLEVYPSVDERINDLFAQIDAIRKELAAIRYIITPHAIERDRSSR